MAFIFAMPKLSPTMESGTIVKWHKKEGEYVNSDDLLLEVGTDKATVEYQAIDEGWLRKISIGEGSDADVNQPIAIFSEAEDESIEEILAQLEAKPIENAKDVSALEPQAEVSSESKSTKVSGASLGLVQFVPEPPIQENDFAFSRGTIKTKASPLAKKIAKEKGLDIASVKGSGPQGRVVAADLEKAQPELISHLYSQEEPKVASGTYEEKDLSIMRKVVAQRLHQSKLTIPHFYVTSKINATGLYDLNKQLKNQGLKITFNDMIVKLTAMCLEEFPNINVGYNGKSHKLIEFKTIDISIAVSVDDGLITPIVRHTNHKRVHEISSEIKYLAGKAKQGKLEPHEFKGGSFTISNLGMFGVDEFQAIINPPQAAILAVSGIQDDVIIKNGQVTVGKTMKLTLSVDHRVIDGAEAAKFLNRLKDLAENPAMCLIR